MKIGSNIVIDSSALLVSLGQPYGQWMDKMSPIPFILYCTDSAISVATVIWHHLLR